MLQCDFLLAPLLARINADIVPSATMKIFQHRKNNKETKRDQKDITSSARMNPTHRLLRTDQTPEAPGSPKRALDSQIIEERYLQDARVTPLADWIKTYRNYAHSGNAHKWALVALKAAIVLINYSKYTMSQDLTREREGRNMEMETVDEREAVEQRERWYGDILDLDGSGRRLLEAFEEELDAQMVMDRVKECERVLLMILGADEHGLLR